MRSYRVVWEIDVDAEDAVDAAIKALEIQRRADSIATHFRVTAPNGFIQEIDLSESEEG